MTICRSPANSTTTSSAIPQKGLEHGAYLILGLGMNTEDRSDIRVILKQLYFCEPRWEDEAGVSYQIRPLDKFLGDVDRPELNYAGPRFTLIRDEQVIAELRNTFLYGSKFLDA